MHTQRCRADFCNENEWAFVCECVRVCPRACACAGAVQTYRALRIDFLNLCTAVSPGSLKCKLFRMWAYSNDQQLGGTSCLWASLLQLARIWIHLQQTRAPAHRMKAAARIWSEYVTHSRFPQLTAKVLWPNSTTSSNTNTFMLTTVFARRDQLKWHLCKGVSVFVTTATVAPKSKNTQRNALSTSHTSFS